MEIYMISSGGNLWKWIRNWKIHRENSKKNCWKINLNSKVVKKILGNFDVNFWIKFEGNKFFLGKTWTQNFLERNFHNWNR